MIKKIIHGFLRGFFGIFLFFFFVHIVVFTVNDKLVEYGIVKYQDTTGKSWLWPWV